MVRARQAVDEKEAERAGLRARLEAARDRARVEVLQAWHDERASRTRYEAARRQVDAAEARRRARADELEAGRVTATPLVDAETDLVRAQLDLLAASVDARIARARTLHALGQWAPERKGTL